MNATSGPSARCYAVLFFCALVLTIVLSNMRSTRQHAQDLQTLGQKWQEGYGAALGKPAGEEWFHNYGVYYVRWAHSQADSLGTNHYGVLEFMGTDQKADPPTTWGTNMLFVLPQCLEKGRLYTVEKKRSGLRFKLIKYKR